MAEECGDLLKRFFLSKRRRGKTRPPAAACLCESAPTAASPDYIAASPRRRDASSHLRSIPLCDCPDSGPSGRPAGLALFLLIVWPTTAAAPDPSPAENRPGGTAMFGIRPGAPIANAQVFVVGTALNAPDRSAGARIPSPTLPKGRSTIRVASIGYKPVQTTVRCVPAAPPLRTSCSRQVRVQMSELTVTDADAAASPTQSVQAESRRGRARSRSRGAGRGAECPSGRLRGRASSSSPGGARRAGQHRGLCPDRGEPLPGGVRQPALHLLDRCRRRLLQQRAALPEPGHAPAGRRGAAGGAGELLPLHLSRSHRQASVCRHAPRWAVPLGTGAPPGAHRAPGQTRGHPRSAAEQSGVPDRCVRLDAV